LSTSKKSVPYTPGLVLQWRAREKGDIEGIVADEAFLALGGLTWLSKEKKRDLKRKMREYTGPGRSFVLLIANQLRE
jgi:hypothetical protein